MTAGGCYIFRFFILFCFLISHHINTCYKVNSPIFNNYRLKKVWGPATLNNLLVARVCKDEKGSTGVVKSLDRQHWWRWEEHPTIIAAVPHGNTVMLPAL